MVLGSVGIGLTQELIFYGHLLEMPVWPPIRGCQKINVKLWVP